MHTTFFKILNDKFGFLSGLVLNLTYNNQSRTCVKLRLRRSCPPVLQQWPKVGLNPSDMHQDLRQTACRLLDNIDLHVEACVRVPTLQNVTWRMKSTIRATLKFVLRRIDLAIESNHIDYVGAWKLFILIARSLLKGLRIEKSRRVPRLSARRPASGSEDYIGCSSGVATRKAGSEICDVGAR